MFSKEKLKQVKSQIKECILPRVLVLCTEEVNTYILSRTGMSAAHFLQYHNKLEIINKGGTTDSLKVRFIDPTDVSGRISDPAAYYMRAISARSHAEDYSSFSLCTPEDLPPFFKAYPEPTPWFGDWLEAFLKCVTPSNQSTINHPVACLMLVSTENPATQGNALWGKEPPAFFRERPFLSTSIPTFYTPVRTSVKAPDVTRAMGELQGAFGGKNCALLKLAALDPASSPPPQSQNSQNLTVQESAGGATTGNFLGNDICAASALSLQKERLSQSDAAEFENFMKTFLSSSVIPYLHTTINTLHAYIQQNKKGFGSRVKSFFRLSDTSSSHHSAGTAPTFTATPHSSSSLSSSAASFSPVTLSANPSEQIAYTPARHLADLQFLIGDYEHSVKGHQQLISGELRGEPLASAYAQTLLGLGHFFNETKSPDPYLQGAIATFCERGDGGRRFSILVMIMRGLVTLMKESGPKAAACFRSASERVGDAFSAGILCEQAAFCCLRPTMRPLLRKFAFFLINAGQYFANVMLTQHAYRCFRLGSCIYSGAGWRKIDDYINMALISHSFACGLYDSAEPCIARVVKHNERSFEMHSSVLRYLLLLYKRRTATLKMSTAALLPELPLPVVPESAITAGVASGGGGGPAFVLRVNDDSPACCEETPQCPLAHIRWPFVGSDNRVVFSGEQAYINVTVINPFDIPLILGQVHAVCEFKPSDNGNAGKVVGGEDESAAAAAVDDDGGVVGDDELRKGNCFKSEMYDVILAGRESKMLNLAINASREGIIRITGFAYKLCKEVWGIHRFSFVPVTSAGSNPQMSLASSSSSSPALLSSSSAQSSGAVQTVPRRLGNMLRRGPRDPNVIVVEPSMPYLTIRFENISSVVFNDELGKVNLVITNHSETASASDIAIAFSHPSFFALENDPNSQPLSEVDSETGSDPFAKVGRPVTPAKSPRLMMSQNDVDLLTWMHFDFTVAPLSNVVIPFWFRPYGFPTETVQTLHTSISYKASPSESTSTNPSKWTRYSHVHTRIVIKPVIHFDVQKLENYKDVESFNVKMTVRNLHPERPLQLKQLSCLSRRCVVEPLFQQASDGLLREREGYNLFLKLRISPSPTYRTSFVAIGDCGQCMDPSVAPYSSLIAQENRERWERKRRALEAQNESKLPFGATNLPSFNTAHLRVKNGDGGGNGVGNDGGDDGPEEMSFITLVWETESVVGFTNMFIPQYTFPKNAALHPAPVAIALESPSSVNYCFEKAEKPVCTVPVKVRIRNFSADKSVRVTVFPLLPDSTLGGLVWAGLTSFGLDNTIAPLETREVVLSLCLMAYGVFNVSDALKVEIADSQSLNVYRTLPSLSYLKHIIEVKEVKF